MVGVRGTGHSHSYLLSARLQTQLQAGDASVSQSLQRARWNSAWGPRVLRSQTTVRLSPADAQSFPWNEGPTQACHPEAWPSKLSLWWQKSPAFSG